MKRTELIQAIRQVRREDGAAASTKLPNGYSVEVHSMRIRPTGGPCRAWKYVYSLASPAGVWVARHVDRQDSFIQCAMRLMGAE